MEEKVQKQILKEWKKTEKVTENREKSIKIKYVLGQGLSADTPEEAADLLLKREYPELVNNLADFGTIIVPEGFIPSITKIIDQDIIDKLEFDQFDEKSKETEKKYKAMMRKYPGDFAERIAFDAIKKFYKERKNTVIVQGLEIINLSNPGQHRESDFIVINVEKKFVLNLEVKNFLGSWNRKQGESLKVRPKYLHNFRTIPSLTYVFLRSRQILQLMKQILEMQRLTKSKR